MTTILIFIPEAIYAANPDKVARLCEAIWRDGDTNPNPNSGWKLVEKVSDPSKRGYVYDVTEHQVRASLDAAQIARLRAILDGTGVLMMRCDDWQAEVESRGWRLVNH